MESSQLIIMSGVGLLALINLISLVWVVNLYKRLGKRPASKNYTIHLDGSKFFADIDADEVRSLVHDKLVTATAKAALQFEQSLSKTVPKLVGDIDEINSKAMQKEFEKYQANIQALSAEAMQDLFKLQQDVANRRTELMEALDAEIVKQYKLRMASFDTRLNDVVSSYIVESLGKGVDLGAQMPYLIETLEKHKDDIKKDMLA